MFKVIEANTPDLLKEALAVRKAVFVDEQGVDLALDQDGKDTLGSTTKHFLILQGDKVIGAARVLYPYEAEGQAKVQRVAVLKSARGTGAGLALMQGIHEALPETESFILGSQQHAVPFYEKLGYVAYGEPFSDADIPHRMMRLARLPVERSSDHKPPYAQRRIP